MEIFWLPFYVIVTLLLFSLKKEISFSRFLSEDWESLDELLLRFVSEAGETQIWNHLQDLNLLRILSFLRSFRLCKLLLFFLNSCSFPILIHFDSVKFPVFMISDTFFLKPIWYCMLIVCVCVCVFWFLVVFWFGFFSRIDVPREGWNFLPFLFSGCSWFTLHLLNDLSYVIGS